jgi:ribonuclease HI
MKAFVDHGYDGLQLHKLNTCRQFLKVITLADITTGDGKRLTDEALAGEPSGTTWHHYNWPRNPAELSRSHWKLWEKALHQAFTSGNTSSTSLQEPLGSWLVDPSDSWQWFYDPISNALYHKTDDDWQAYTPTSSRSTHSSRPTNKAFKLNPSIFIPPNIRSLEPATTRPLSSLHDSDTVIFTGSAQPHQPAVQQAEEPTLQLGMTLQEAVTVLPESEKWAVESCNIPENVDFVIAQAIRNGIAVAASDGSFDEATGIATSGYQLCSATTELQFDNSITGANQSPGEAEDQSSYRSELAGILGVLVMVQSLCTLYEIQEGAIEVALDNKSAAEQSAGDWLLRPRQRDYDMLLDIRSRLQALPIQVNFRWVKGHQDSSPPSNGRELDAWAKMNITADALAGQFRLAIGQRYRPNIPFRYEKWTLWYEHKKLTHFHIPSMYAKVYTPCLAYYVQKHGLTEEMVTRQINWESLKHAMKRIPWGKQRWLVKFATGHCAVGRMEKRRQHQQHDNCPLCDQEDETTVHVLRCHDERARKHWAASLASLNKWMGDHKTKPTLQRGIITLLQGWYDDGTIHFPTGHFQDQQVRQALEEQANIGVYNLLLGRFSKQFIDIQSAYIRYIDKDSKMTGQTWSTAFLVELWNLPWEMWEHRNGILHGATNTPQQQRSVEELLLEVNAELEQGPDTLLVPDQQLVDRDPNTFRAMSIHQLKQWLLTVHQARMAYWAHQHTADNLEDQNPGPEHRTLREWLLSSSSNPATDNLTVEIPEDTPPSEDSAPAPPPPPPSQQVRQTNTRPSAVPRRLAKGLARSRKFFQNWQSGRSQSS